MKKLPNTTIFRIILFVLLPAVFIMALLAAFLVLYGMVRVNLSLNLPEERYTFQNLEINYSLVGKNPGIKKPGLLKFSLCSLRPVDCRELGRKDVEISTKSYAEKLSYDLNPKADPGVYAVVLSLYQKDNNKLITQLSKPINLKKISDELYMNISLDKKIVSDGDYVKIEYTFMNKSKIEMSSEEFALTVNFAGPLEIALGRGQLIADVSSGLSVDLKGKTVWVIKEYKNRQGGMFNVSLLLSRRGVNGELLPVSDVVGQVRWP